MKICKLSFIRFFHSFKNFLIFTGEWNQVLNLGVWDGVSMSRIVVWVLWGRGVEDISGLSDCGMVGRKDVERNNICLSFCSHSKAHILLAFDLIFLWQNVCEFIGWKLVFFPLAKWHFFGWIDICLHLFGWIFGSHFIQIPFAWTNESESADS